MLIPPGSTDVSVDVQIIDDTGLPVAGLAAATFPATYWTRAGNTAATQITPLSDLALITTAHADGGVKERSGGYYRLDLPDAALASAGTVKLIAEVTDKRMICEPIEVRKAPATIAAGDMATNAIDAESIKADAVTKIAAGVDVLVEQNEDRPYTEVI